MQNILFAFLLTIIVGLSTGLGSLIGLCIDNTGYSFITFLRGFFYGVVINLTLIFPILISDKFLTSSFGGLNISGIAIFVFIIAQYLSLIIFNENLKDKIISFFIPIEEVEAVKYLYTSSYNNFNSKNIMFSAVLVAINICIYNLYVGYMLYTELIKQSSFEYRIFKTCVLYSVLLGFVIFIPIFLATANKKTAFMYSFSTGLFVPLGVLLGSIFLKNTVIAFIAILIVSFLGSSALSCSPYIPKQYRYKFLRESTPEIIGLILSVLTVMGIGLIFNF